MQASRHSQRMLGCPPRVVSERARGVAAYEAGEATSGHPQRSKCIVHRVLRRGSCATIPAVSVHSFHKNSAGVHRPFGFLICGAVTIPSFPTTFPQSPRDTRWVLLCELYERDFHRRRRLTPVELCENQGRNLLRWRAGTGDGGGMVPGSTRGLASI